MYGCHGQGLFTMENVIIMYLSITLEIVLWETSFKDFWFLLTWDINLGFHTSSSVAKPFWICPSPEVIGSLYIL